MDKFTRELTQQQVVTEQGQRAFAAAAAADDRDIVENDDDINTDDMEYLRPREPQDEWQKGYAARLTRLATVIWDRETIVGLQAIGAYASTLAERDAADEKLDQFEGEAIRLNTVRREPGRLYGLKALEAMVRSEEHRRKDELERELARRRKLFAEPDLED